MSTNDAFKAALWTALFSFITLFGVSAVGWLQDVVVWASESGASDFPDLSVLGYGLVSAVASVAIGFVNFVIRFAQAKGLFGQSASEVGPTYTPVAPVQDPGGLP
jgi:amino acid transporter